jgi:hypothetical protein
VAHDRLHADDGGRHPHDGVPAAPLHDAHDVRRRDGALLAGTLVALLAPGFEVLVVARVIQASARRS